MNSMSIGQVAKAAQVGIDTVRFYEKQVAPCPGHGAPEHCPILRAFDAEEGVK